MHKAFTTKIFAQNPNFSPFRSLFPLVIDDSTSAKKPSHLAYSFKSDLQYQGLNNGKSGMGGLYSVGVGVYNWEEGRLHPIGGRGEGVYKWGGGLQPVGGGLQPGFQ